MRVTSVINSPTIFAIYLGVFAVVGMGIGALVGLLASLVAGYGSKWILKDTFLGAIGLVAGFFGCTPWPRNAVVVAIVIAVLLPVLNEVYRFNQARTDRA